MISSLDDEQDKPKIRYFLEMTLKLIPFASLYFNVFIFIYAQPTLATLFTYKWVPLATEPLRWLAASLVISSLASYLSFITDGLGLVKEKVSIATKLIVGTLVVSPLAIYGWGIIGLAVVSFVNQSIFVLLLVKLLKRHITFTIPIGNYLRYSLFFGSVIVFGTMVGYMPKTLWEFLLTGGVYTLLVIVFAWQQKLVDEDMIHPIKEKFLKRWIN